MKKSHLKLGKSVRQPQGRQQVVAQAPAYRRRDTVPDHYLTLWGAKNPRAGVECELGSSVAGSRKAGKDRIAH